MADLQLEIPQDIKQRFNQAFGPGGRLVGREEQQIDIGMRGHFAAPIATHRNHGDVFSGGRIGQRMQVVQSDPKRGSDDLIGQPCIGACRRAGGKRGFGKSIGDGCAPAHLGLRENSNGGGTNDFGISLALQGRDQRAFDRRCVEDVLRRTEKTVRRRGVCADVIGLGGKGVRAPRHQSFWGLGQR